MTAKATFTQQNIPSPVHSWTYSTDVLVDGEIPDAIQKQFEEFGFNIGTSMWASRSNNYNPSYKFVFTPVGVDARPGDFIFLYEGETIAFHHYGVASTLISPVS